MPLIDLSSLASAPPPADADRNPDPWRPVKRKKKKTKSLFAQQFGDKDLSFFGIESVPTSHASSDPLTICRDYVDPVSIGGDVVVVGEGQEPSHDVEREGTPEAGIEGSPEAGLGEGLGDRAGELTQADMEKIHRENLDKLASLSVDQILEEKQRIEKTLSMFSSEGVYRLSLNLSFFRARFGQFLEVEEEKINV